MRAEGPASIALAHEWLVHRYGSEKTFEAMAETFPAADLYALTHDRSAPLDFGGREVSTTLLDRLPVVRDQRELQLPLMPLAWRYATRRRYDVVVTSSHACAKGFWPGRSALHLCYCYTPMRYVWLDSVDRRRPLSRPEQAAARLLRRWDRSSIRWVDGFAAISSAVADRVRLAYDREARVIHPPVATDFFMPPPATAAGRAGENEFALVVSRMVPYKRVDLAIRACRENGIRLVVAGSGPEEGALRALAAELGADVSFVISPDDEALRDLYRRARVVLFLADEDFGIVTVEAQACGTPVVALARGGSLDTVVPGVTGVLVPDQSEAAAAKGLEEALATVFDAGRCRAQAERFSAPRFRSEFGGWVREAAAARGLEA
ncbi:MAG TPA: glycosyltransferase [Acidimicrobiales bacterium]